MHRSTQIILSFLLICSILLAFPAAVQAVPPLPSSYYGLVKVNGGNVSDGTLVEALAGGKVISQAFSQTYQGNSVYSLDIPGDESGTAAIEGGVEGETISFRVGGVLATETGTWHSGTNAELNLSCTTTVVIATPQTTPTRLPTQTPGVVSPTKTKTAVPSQTVKPTETKVSLQPTTLQTATERSVLATIPLTSRMQTETMSSAASVKTPEKKISPQRDVQKTLESVLITIIVVVSLLVLLVIIRLMKRSR